MAEENNKLKLENLQLKQKISKNTSAYDQREKIKDIQKNLKRMTTRI